MHKKNKLTKKEYDIIKKHPQIGAEIIRTVHFLNEVVPIVLYHHERYDGLGYSAGLKGKEIPLGARIIAVADVYQALISDRPYRKAYSKKDALEIIKESTGTHLDPDVVKVFLANLGSEKSGAKKYVKKS
ncbi:MAG: HD domain-containing phosphohydrolase [Candidatus Omnitrophota bacterium]|nr:HD domain-containing phosphohydrolase [Candidatus Omnitrophota bacterium]